MYKGRLVRLRRLETDDVSAILPHWNNYELRQYLPTPLPTGHDEMIEYIKSANEAYSKRKAFTFGIETLDTKKLIGLVNLINISWISSNAELGLLAIFDPEHWGRGYGKDAMLVTLDLAFSTLGLNSVYLWVASFNSRAIAFYEKLGFKTQGKLRELAYRDGQRYDVVTMDILKSEFLEEHGVLPK